ncbi:MAG: protoporphyrinogen oxidase [Actinomycetota bacterium]
MNERQHRGRRVAVIGGGIAGTATALELRRADATIDVTLFEGATHVGGRIASTPFAGISGLDAGADAFLARVPEAVALATSLDLDLVSPEPVGAAIWRDGLHAIPDGLLLGLPGRPWPLVRSSLLSWRSTLRAAIEPLVPRTSLAPDSVGAYVRTRFGDEVHEVLVDSLVGSIYAADTDRFSLAEVPQLHQLASTRRSVLLAGRFGAAGRARRPGTATAAAGPIFAAPRGGMADLVTAAADAVVTGGGELRLGHPIQQVATDGSGWRVDDERFDAVILATPPLASAPMLADVAPDASALLARAETADVVMVVVHLPESAWPERLHGLSGYLIPKTEQRTLTAVSFGSQKWAHWQPADGGVILRASLGRDGAPVAHLDDDTIVARTLDDLALQLGIDPTPIDVRITRWPGAFAQYRPHHRRWVEAVEAALPAEVGVTGAGYRGIGIPACVRDAKRIVNRTVQSLNALS